MEILRECPFCGGNNLKKYTDLLCLSYEGESKFILCNICQIYVYEKIWNTRHSPYELLIRNFIEDVLNHKNNGYDEVSARWVLNQFATVTKENE